MQSTLRLLFRSYIIHNFLLGNYLWLAYLLQDIVSFFLYIYFTWWLVSGTILWSPTVRQIIAKNTICTQWGKFQCKEQNLNVLRNKGKHLKRKMCLPTVLKTLISHDINPWITLAFQGTTLKQHWYWTLAFFSTPKERNTIYKPSVLFCYKSRFFYLFFRFGWFFGWSGFGWVFFLVGFCLFGCFVLGFVWFFLFFVWWWGERGFGWLVDFLSPVKTFLTLRTLHLFIGSSMNFVSLYFHQHQFRTITSSGPLKPILFSRLLRTMFFLTKAWAMLKNLLQSRLPVKFSNDCIHLNS